ncbi:MAG TPA: endonuclease/exonuclease/phosphatase family protein [Calditrichia bacterium]|nr:endonuclease/exonuclease/phosphatase family protein [Calditrichia bacterium]
MAKMSMVFVLLLLAGCGSEPPLSLRVMSFNIRFDNPDDGPNAWPQRREMASGLIREVNPDVLGLQEALLHQIEQLQDDLPEYAWFGVGRDDGQSAGEFSPIFYRKDKFELLMQETLWCSETPHQPGLGWDAVCNRVITWGGLRDRGTGKIAVIFNTHWDHIGENARLQSAVLLRNEVAKVIPGEYVVVTGDFNCPPGSPPYRHLVAARENGGEPVLFDSRKRSLQAPQGPTGTFNAFGPEAVRPEPIDHIFVGEGISVQRFATLDKAVNGRMPSDHFPVVAEMVCQ